MQSAPPPSPRSQAVTFLAAPPVTVNPKEKPAMIRQRTLALVTVVAVALFAVANAAPFTDDGTSYSANVAHRLDAAASLMTSVSGVTTTGVQANGPAQAVDWSRASWQLTAIPDDTETATVKVTLDQPYDLNRIITAYLDYRPTNYELRVSPDDSSWTTVVASTPITVARHTDTFAVQPGTQYIEWQIWGPGVDLGGGATYAYLNELQAFVSSATATPPELDDGYNVISSGTLIDATGTSLAASLDGVLLNYAIPGAGGGSVVVDLGDLTPLHHFNFDFFPGQQWATGQLRISEDRSTWTTVVNATNLGTSSYTIVPTWARYIELSGTGNGALVELSAFATFVPEPMSAVLLGLAAAGLLLKRGGRAE